MKTEIWVLVVAPVGRGARAQTMAANALARVVLLWSVVALSASASPSHFAAAQAPTAAPRRVPDGVKPEQNTQWRQLLRNAGKEYRGLVLCARLPSDPIVVGDEFDVYLSIKNVSEVSSTISFVRGDVGYALVRDEAKKPVELSRTGLDRVSRALPMNPRLAQVTLSPGEAISLCYPLSSDFVFRKAGKYDVVVGWGSLVADPAELTLYDKSAKEPRKTAATMPREHVVRKAATTEGSEEEWQSFRRLAGAEVGGCILETSISPCSPSAVHLVISVTCVRDMNPRKSPVPWHPKSCTVMRGSLPWDYRILIRDSTGKAVPMTTFARKLFQRQSKDVLRDVSFGSSTGTWLPLDELFSLESGSEYTVLAVIPNETDLSPALVSSPLKIRVPQLSSPGLTRPLYGSDQLWQRLAARAAMQDRTLAVNFEMAHSDHPFQADKIPKIVLRSRSGRTLETEATNAETTVLVRDSKGCPQSPMATYDRAVGGRLDVRPFQTVEQVPGRRADNTTIDAYPRFPDQYPIISGEPYTLLAGIRLRGDHPSFLVAGPLTYIPTYEGDYYFSKDGATGRLLPNPVFCTNSSPQLPWDSVMHFAGTPFGDLRLTAAAVGRGELKLALVNEGYRSIIVKKWEGLAGFDVQVRDAEGKAVALTEKGGMVFAGGAAIDTRNLERQGVIEHTVSITDLFDVRPNGEYTVLASVPVVGDVDAVLTAMPLKMRIGSKRAETPN